MPCESNSSLLLRGTVGGYIENSVPFYRYVTLRMSQVLLYIEAFFLWLNRECFIAIRANNFLSINTNILARSDILRREQDKSIKKRSLTLMNYLKSSSLWEAENFNEGESIEQGAMNLIFADGALFVAPLSSCVHE